MYQKKHKSQTELAAAFYETYKKRIYQIARYLSPDEDACSELVQETLCALLDHLDLLRGKYIEGKSAQELAEMLGCKPDSIRMKMLRARRRAFHILQER